MILPKTLEAAVVLSNKDIGKGVKEMLLCAPRIAAMAQPGQFVHLRVAQGTYHPLLRRPISIAGADKSKGHVRIIYRIVGHGTQWLGNLGPKEKLDVMGPLGTGFYLQGERPLLVGGGMGLAPLLFLAQALCPRPIEILMGGRNKEEMFWQEMFGTICSNLHITTDDGSLGVRGLTVDMLPELLRQGNYDMIYTCGPKVMMEQVFHIADSLYIPCQLSLEEHMACGVGACLSCTCQSAEGARKKICADGPVFWGGEVFACR
jgi:dihydroorotate dehydrogenase electron transfer subunit